MHAIKTIYDYNGHWDNGKRPTWPYLDQSPKLCHHMKKSILQYFHFIYKRQLCYCLQLIIDMW